MAYIFWSEEDEQYLLDNLENCDWNLDKLPVVPMLDRLKGRTGHAVMSKAKRMKKKFEKQEEENAKKHKWTTAEQIGIFKYYKEGLSTREIHSKLITFSPDVTIEQLEDELIRLRKEAEKAIRAYAEERGLKVAKTLHLDTIKFFFDNKNTTSDFTRKALHTRIARG